MAAARHALLLVALSLGGCATLSTTGEVEPDYAQDAETNLARGNQAFESRNYAEALKYFEHVRSRYPYLDVAKRAELRIADTHFAREEYIEARDAYLNFVKLHPTWPKVDYAAFRASLTHYKEIPSDFFLLPPSEDRAEADQILADARKRLARHELYVASFYKRRERWRAVANRLETVAEEYQGLGFDEEALFGLHDAYTHLNEKEKARKALEEILARMPGTRAAEKARALLGAS